MNPAVAVCYGQLVALTYVVAVLMGAPLLADSVRTLLFSVYVVTVGFLPMIVRAKGNLRDVYRCVVHGEGHLLARNLVWGTVVGAWLGAIPIPLDWDRWWQRWPITCLVSSTIGAGVSVAVSYGMRCV